MHGGFLSRFRNASGVTVQWKFPGNRLGINDFGIPRIIVSDRVIDGQPVELESRD